jgi:hypothetical protein
MESVLAATSVSSIAEAPFAGDPFPGHDRINHSLADLQAVVSQARPDWRIALESMKGVYVIHDRETGQRYVGSAYGDTGIWQRWATYAATLHGAGLCPVAIKAGTVLPCLKGYIVSKIIAGGIFQSLHQTVVQCTIEVVALYPSHLAYLAHGAEAQLGMSLVAPSLLTLSRLTDIVR